MYQHIRTLQFAALLITLFSLGSCLLSKTNAPKTKKLRHVVAFKFKPEITHEQMQKTTDHFHSLKAEIPQIIEFEGGADIAFQKKNGKYTHCFVVTVSNEKDLAIYGEHPVHKAFSKSVDPLLAEVMVIDYWTE